MCTLNESKDVDLSRDIMMSFKTSVSPPFTSVTLACMDVHLE